MTGISTFLGAFWRLISWMPGFMFRRKFSKRWLAERTVIDIRSRHDPVRVQGGELPGLEIWLTVSNRGHFPIELDRLALELTYGAAIVRSSILRRQPVEAGQTVEIMVREALTSGQIAHIVKAKSTRPYSALQVQAEFNCKVHNFSVDTGQLQGLNPEFINC